MIWPTIPEIGGTILLLRRWKPRLMQRLICRLTEVFAGGMPSLLKSWSGYVRSCLGKGVRTVYPVDSLSAERLQSLPEDEGNQC